MEGSGFHPYGGRVTPFWVSFTLLWLDFTLMWVISIPIWVEIVDFYSSVVGFYPHVGGSGWSLIPYGRFSLMGGFYSCGFFFLHCCGLELEAGGVGGLCFHACGRLEKLHLYQMIYRHNGCDVSLFLELGFH